MKNTTLLGAKRATLGDVAVDGLINGLVGGIVMLVYLGVVALVGGEGAAQLLSRFDPSPTPSPVVGSLLHLAVAGIYGALFQLAMGGLGIRRVSERFRAGALGNWLMLGAGLGYGLLLLAFALIIVLPRTGSPLREVSQTHFGIANIVYGVALGWMAGKAK